VRTKESLEISDLSRIFSAARRRSKDLLEIRLFRCVLEFVVGISALSLEIPIVSRKFERIAGNPPKSVNFSTCAGSFRSSAELLDFQPEIRNFGWRLHFPLKIAIFQRSFFISAELFNFPEAPSTIR
jgi:hypothetical protein